MKKNNLFTICISLVFIMLIGSCKTTKNNSVNNLVAIMEVKEPIEGVCDNDKVYVIFSLPGNGQIKAKAPKTDEELIEELNSKVTFLKDKATYEDEGMINIVINCRGEMVRCQIDSKTKNLELDNQIVAVFAKMKKWSAAKIHGNYVDSAVLYSFTIKNGKISL